MDAPLPPNEAARLEELRRAEESIAAVGAWQRAILDSADVSIIATNPQGVIQTSALAFVLTGHKDGARS